MIYTHPTVNLFLYTTEERVVLMIVAFRGDDGGTCTRSVGAYEALTSQTAGSGRCLAGGTHGRRGTPCPCTRGYAPEPAEECDPDE